MFCPNCGAQISDQAVVCVKCGREIPKSAVPAPADDDAVLRMLVPVGRSGWAIAAGYLGLLSLIPFVGVLAIALGIVAVCDLRKHPDKHGAGRAWFGIIAGGLSMLMYGFVIFIGYRLASLGC